MTRAGAKNSHDLTPSSDEGGELTRHALGLLPMGDAKVDRGQQAGARQPGRRYTKAPTPVMSRPTMSDWIVSVPSNVWMASMSAMWRITW
jgi:hypothetical protein